MSDWVVVVPFKGAPDGKSRLADSGLDRAALAAAFLADTVAAARAVDRVARVLVVTNEPLVGYDTVADPKSGLNAAVSEGIRAAREAHSGAWVAVLLGDLPALRPGDLLAALAEAENLPLGVVADHDGTGSTTITAAPGTSPRPHFGVGSFAAHREAGFVALSAPPASTLRMDVDTADDLAAFAAGGFGPATTAALAASLTFLASRHPVD